MLGLFNKFAKSKKSLNVIAKENQALTQSSFCANTMLHLKTSLQNNGKAFTTLTFIGIFFIWVMTFLLGSAYYNLFDLNHMPL